MSINILEFLQKLDNNLTLSINTFQNINKYNITDISTLHDLIQSNNKKLYNYLECLSQLETLHFANKDFSNDSQFIFSCNIDSDLHNKNLNKRFKDTLKTTINIHKFKKAIAKNKPSTPLFETRDINTIESVNITPNNLNIPVVKNLKDIPPMFYFYDGGDNPYKKGIYTCLAPGFCVKVPFPSTISTTNPNFKINSIPCKYETRDACTKNKKNISEIYKSDVRECFYVHKKEKFAKIGSFYKCNMDDLGNHDTLNSSIDHLNTSDVRRLLMYSLSDSLISALWYQNKFKDGSLLLNNIEIY